MIRHAHEQARKYSEGERFWNGISNTGKGMIWAFFGVAFLIITASFHYIITHRTRCRQCIQCGPRSEGEGDFFAANDDHEEMHVVNDFGAEREQQFIVENPVFEAPIYPIPYENDDGTDDDGTNDSGDVSEDTEETEPEESEESEDEEDEEAEELNTPDDINSSTDGSQTFEMPEMLVLHC